MAKKKSNYLNKNKNGSNNSDHLNDVIASAKAKKEKNAAKSEEIARQAAMSTMSAEEKKLFMSQEEILDREKNAAKKEEKLNAEQESLDRRIAECTEKENNLSEREEKITSDEKIITDKKKMLEKKQCDLDSRERELIERENNAEAGFTAQNQRSLESLRKAQKDLKEEISELQKKKFAAEDKLQEELQQFREQRMAQIEKEIETYKESVQAEIDTAVKAIKTIAEKDIAQRKDLLEQTRRDLEKERKEVNDQKNAQDNLQRKMADANADIEFKSNMLKQKNDTLEDRVESEVKKKADAVIFELKNVTEENNALKKRLSDAQEQISEYKKRELAANGASAEELLETIERLKDEREQIKQELALRPKDEQLEAYRIKADNYTKIKSEYENKKIEAEELRFKLDKYTMFEIELAMVRENADRYKKLAEIRELTLKTLGEEIDRYKSLYEQPKALESRLDSIFEHEINKMECADYDQDHTEAEWLENIYEKCKNSGISFNKRLLKSFHTSLKTADWSPLTVLAGVSGTGKSLLPEYYCRFGGIYFKSMAVQPDWDSPQSLFGFFNSIDNRFNATTLIRAMVQFADYEHIEASVKMILNKTNSEDEAIAFLQKMAVEKYNLNDTMFMVLLDEMNLAHVELYFSDMLSKLEKRRNSNDVVNVEIDMGAGMSKFPLELSDNILWVGTMNEDETTKSLSDKVLDRGNLISFPRPQKFMSRKKLGAQPAAKMLKKSIWEKWVNSSVIENEYFSEAIEEYRECLEKLNGYLGTSGRALGHRVWQAIENYMANHPDVISAFTDQKSDKEKRSKCMQRAFEEALVHKVMPKLRGVETDGELKNKCIDPIKNLLFGKQGLAKDLEKDFNNALVTTSFLWCSAEYLNEE